MQKMESEISASTCLPATSETENAIFDYEAQHFGFTPINLLNGMFNTVCDLYREALKACCKTCAETYPNVVSEEELRNSRHAVSELIDKDICMMFDRLEYFLLHQVFSIPENAVLPEDRCQLQRLSQVEQSAIEKNIIDVKKRILAVKYANAVLGQHLKDAESLQGTLGKNFELSSPDSSLSQLEGKNLKDLISYSSEMLRKCLNPDKSTDG